MSAFVAHDKQQRLGSASSRQWEVAVRRPPVCPTFKSANAQWQVLRIAIERVAPLPIERFGEPTKTDRSEIQNRMGAKFEQVTYFWAGKGDSEVLFRKYAGTVNSSALHSSTKEDRDLPSAPPQQANEPARLRRSCREFRHLMAPSPRGAAGHSGSQAAWDREPQSHPRRPHPGWCRARRRCLDRAE